MYPTFISNFDGKKSSKSREIEELFIGKCILFVSLNLAGKNRQKAMKLKIYSFGKRILFAPVNLTGKIRQIDEELRIPPYLSVSRINQ